MAALIFYRLSHRAQVLQLHMPLMLYFVRQVLLHLAESLRIAMISRKLNRAVLQCVALSIYCLLV